MHLIEREIRILFVTDNRETGFDGCEGSGGQVG